MFVKKIQQLQIVLLMLSKKLRDFEEEVKSYQNSR